jgi:hypothetical protein
VRLAQDQEVPSDAWTKIEFDAVLWDTAGTFDLERCGFVAPQDLECDFRMQARLVSELATGLVEMDIALYKNGEEMVSSYLEELARNAPPDELHLRAGGVVQPALRGRHFEHAVPLVLCKVQAKAGDVFEVHVRHDVGATVRMTVENVPKSLEPEFWTPTMTHFMGMYRV